VARPGAGERIAEGGEQLDNVRSQASGLGHGHPPSDDVLAGGDHEVAARRMAPVDGRPRDAGAACDLLDRHRPRTALVEQIEGRFDDRGIGLGAAGPPPSAAS
jgi:hypothetical protein